MDITTVFEFIKQLLATVMILLTMISPAFGGNGAKYEAENPDELIMSFSAVSDIHVETNNPATFGAFNDLLEGLKGGEDIDAVVYTGDNVMNGQALENFFFYSGVRAVKPAENNFVALGNHDIGNGEGDYDKYCQSFLANNNFYLGNKLEKPYYYKVVNGCYMIFLASENLSVNYCSMSDEQLSWLEAVLDEAQAADAAIFVFNHHPIFSLDGVGWYALSDLLSGYDNLLYIYGHTHDKLDEDNFKTERGVDTINLSRSTETVYYEPGDGIVVEVYEDEILVKGRNFIDGEWIDGLEYRYTVD